MTIHMQEAEAVRDFSKVLEHVAAGDEVRLERDGRQIAVIHDVHDSASRRTRSIDEIIGRLKERKVEHCPIVFDDEFAADVAKAHEFWNQPLDTSKWD